ncbi:MAG: chromosome partitioning ATPase, partial [Casimicrobiaceae bacterium]
MGLIEQAAQRLEALRKAGIDAPVRTNSTIEAAADALREPTLREPSVPVAEALSAPITGPAPFEAPDVDPRRGHRVEPKLPHPVVQEPSGDGRRSRLVELDLEALAAAGYLTPEGKRTQLADEFRVVKRPIIKNAQGRGAGQIERGNRVMVTSALPGEGKTFCALNLAISIATEVDSTVLLVDADVANPSVM